MARRITSLLLLPALLLGGCMTTRTVQSTTWGEPRSGWEIPGRVEGIRQTVTRTEGNPAGGALAGALIGGLFGSLIGGHTHYDRWGNAHTHASGAGAVVGAIGGAAVGAAASSGPPIEDRTYEVLVRLDDGSRRAFAYRGPPPFKVGDDVLLTDRGLVPFR